jgi:hypothetical protein
MTGGRDEYDEMDRYRLDDVTAERLLSGQIDPDDAPPGYRSVAAALHRASAASSPGGSPARELATVAAVVDAVRSTVPDVPLPRRRRMLTEILTAKVAAIAAVTVLGATAAAAATNSLPDPAQRAVSHMASHVGLSVPGPNSHANAHATAAHGAAGDHATGPDATGNAQFGLCTAYAAGPDTTNPHSRKNDAVAFRNLQKAADDAGLSIADFCKNVTPPTTSGTTPETEADAPDDHAPPVSTPGKGGPPSVTPPVSTPRGSGPPASTPPFSTPPVSTPVTTPPVSVPVGPPSSVPPVSTPDGNGHRP